MLEEDEILKTLALSAPVAPSIGKHHRALRGTLSCALVSGADSFLLAATCFAIGCDCRGGSSWRALQDRRHLRNSHRTLGFSPKTPSYSLSHAYHQDRNCHFFTLPPESDPLQQRHGADCSISFPDGSVQNENCTSKIRYGRGRNILYTAGLGWC